MSSELDLLPGYFNVFDDDVSDIARFYESPRLAESSCDRVIHFHPVEARTPRATATWRF